MGSSGSRSRRAGLGAKSRAPALLYLAHGLGRPEWPAAGTAGSPQASPVCLYMLSLWGFPGMVVSTLQRNTPQERQPGRSCITFDELASKATQNHFCYLLLLRSKSLRPAQYLKGGELGLLMGGVSNHMQPCVKTTAPLTGTGLACVCLLIWMSLVQWEKIQGCSLLEMLGVR